MAIETVAILGRGAVGLLYGTMAEKNLGPGAVEFVMDDERFARHAGETVTVNGEPCRVPTIPASGASPVDLVILAIKAPGLPVALDTMERLVGPHTAIASLINGVTSEERVAERFGWERTVLSVAQGMDAVFIGTNMAYGHPGEIRFGAAPGTAAGVVDDVADLYARAGIPHVVETDIRRRMWVKLMLNVGINQTCMVFGGTYGSASETGSEQNRCFVAAMREALAVAPRRGRGRDRGRPRADGPAHGLARPRRHALDGAGPHKREAHRGRGVLWHHLSPRRAPRSSRPYKPVALPADSRAREQLCDKTVQREIV